MIQMMTQTTCKLARIARPLRVQHWIGLLATLLVVTFPFQALASSALKNMSYQALPGGKVVLNLGFTGTVPAPRIFTTQAPPRIAVDFDNTSLAVTRRHLKIGSGVASSVTAVSAGGRTRIVVDLLNSASYTTKVAGNKLVMTIRPVQSHPNLAGPGNPSKRLPGAAGPAITGIDFHRTEAGAGRVVINFASRGAHINMRRLGSSEIVDIGNTRLPRKLAQKLDVTDFATPVISITTRPQGQGARMRIAVKGAFEPSGYQTGNKFVVEIQAKSKPGTATTRSGVIGNLGPKKYSGARVTFNFQNIATRSALQLIADVSNLNIVASDSVGGDVTLHLVNVPWDQALAVIMRAKGLGEQRDGNVIWIAPQTEIASFEQARAEARMRAQEAQPLVTDYIPISYGKASNIAKLLTQKSLQSNSGGAGASQSTRGFLSPRGSVTFDERTNTLIVSDIPQKIREIRALVKVLDRPVKQVLIESRIVIATDNFTRELGARFGVSGFRRNPSGQLISTGSSLGSTSSLDNSIAAQQAVIAQNAANASYAAQQGTTPAQPTLAPAITFPGGLNVNLPVATPAGSFGLAILGSNYLLNLELSAAQTEGKGEVISSPRVITANQQPAIIKQGQEIGYVTFQNSGAGGGGLGGTATVQFKDAVLELKVTPTITADNRIFLDLDVKKDALAGFINNPGGGQVPQIDTRQIKTGVLVDNGQTVVLGGIYEINKQNTVTKVPGLGDIPGVGFLFRNKSRNNTKAELLIFVTPRILDDSLR